MVGRTLCDADAAAPTLPILKQQAEKFFALLADGVCLTANHRLARALQQQYARQRHHQQPYWQTPAIYHGEDWLRRQWLEIADGEQALLLQPAQEIHLWQQAIEQDGHLGHAALLTLAEMAMVADHTMQRWQLRLPPLQDSQTAQFLRWQQRYRQRCRQLNSIDSGQLPTLLCAAAAQLAARHPRLYTIASSQRLDPCWQMLLQAMVAAGTKLRRLRVPAYRRCQPLLLRCRQPKEELQAALDWAAERLAQDSGARLGLVVIDLAQQRQTLLSLLDQRWLADANNSHGEPGAVIYNISLSPALAEQPLIATAMELLALRWDGLSRNRLLRLINSPFIGLQHHSWQLRQQLQRRIRKLPHHHFEAATIVALLPAHLPLTAALQKTLPKQAFFTQWITLFQQILHHIGWPRGTTADLSSTEYQAQQQWQQVLAELALLDHTARSSVTGSEAIRRLQALLRSKRFQPQNTELPLQILSPEQAEGLSFDGLWICGLRDDHWPPAAHPVALLPAAMQRQAAVPQSDPKQQLLSADSQLRHWLRASKELRLSFPQQSDEQILTASRLLSEHWPQQDWQPPNEAQDIATQLWLQRSPLQQLSDPYCPISGPLQGHAAWLRDQALCPFRAFARWRLQATEQRLASIGVEPLRRGQLLHAALEYLWQQWGSQQQLLQCPPAQRQSLIEKAIASAVQADGKKHTPLPTPILQQEQELLQKLLQRLLEQEQKRDDFVVVAVEQEQQWQAGNLLLNLRIDRIDRLADSGQLLIIDYKSGPCQISHLLKQPLVEIQLPLYIMSTETTASAVALFPVHQEAAGPQALAARPLTGFKQPRQPLDWPLQKQRWQTTVEGLAKAFCDGDARVLPQQQACQYCDLDALCRITERQ